MTFSASKCSSTRARALARMVLVVGLGLVQRTNGAVEAAEPEEPIESGRSRLGPVCCTTAGLPVAM
jgi:hypothetical protein